MDNSEMSATLDTHHTGRWQAKKNNKKTTTKN